MEEHPKLQVKRESRENSAEILDFNQAISLPFGKGYIVVIEGHLVNSYDEFINLCEIGKFKNKEYLDVLILPLIFGG
jgi:hypothetical protein